MIIQTFFGKVISLLFNMLSRFVITFLPRSKHLLISWMQSPSAVILEPPKIKSVPVSIVSQEKSSPLNLEKQMHVRNHNQDLLIGNRSCRAIDWRKCSMDNLEEILGAEFWPV